MKAAFIFLVHLNRRFIALGSFVVFLVGFARETVVGLVTANVFFTVTSFGAVVASVVFSGFSVDGSRVVVTGTVCVFATVVGAVVWGIGGGFVAGRTAAPIVKKTIYLVC